MDSITTTAAQRALATPEIVEHILTALLADLVPPTNRDDARSDSVQHNARILLLVFRCSEVASVWRSCVLHGPPSLQRALLKLRESEGTRSWNQQVLKYPSQQSYYRGLAFRAPVLNPVLQTAFEGYKFRYWRSGLGAEGPRHHAYLIVTRRHIEEIQERLRLGHGKVVRRTFLAQPPPIELRATIWERDDNCTHFTNRTTAINEDLVRNVNGVSLDDVLGHARRIFQRCHDVLSLKFTTV